MSNSITPAILSQHAEEASFLWLLRTHAVSAFNYRLPDLAKLDGRIEAHLDGLVVAGDEGWAYCRDELGWKESGEVFAAAVLALASKDQARYRQVMDVVLAAPAAVAGLASALGWAELSAARPWIDQLIASPEPVLKRAGIAGAAMHRNLGAPPLAQAIETGDEVLAPRAAKAVGEMGRRELLPLLKSHLRSPSPVMRFWAAWSISLLSNDATATEVLRQLVEMPPAGAPDISTTDLAAAMVVRRTPVAAANTWIKHLAKAPTLRRTAIVAAGVLGDPANVEWLLGQMAAMPCARAAGESFATMAGVDLALDGLDAKPPQDVDFGPTEDAADEAVAMDPDRDLPFPNVANVRDWWAKNAGRFAAGQRFIAGHPLAAEPLTQVLKSGRQSRRAAAAMELSSMQQGVLFETRARARRQARLIGA